MMERSRSKPDIFRDLSRNLRNLQEQITVLFNRDLSVDWIAATLINAWANFSDGTDGNHLAAYSRDSSGVVRLKGVIKTGTVGTVAFVLPVGFRPGLSAANQGSKKFPVVSAGAFGYVSVKYNGDVSVDAGSNTWVDLSSVQFRAEL